MILTIEITYIQIKQRLNLYSINKFDYEDKHEL